MLALSWLVQACSTAASLSAPPSSSPTPLIDVVELGVRDIQTAYATGEFTAVELTRAFLDRIDRYEGHYNALISMNADALAIAAALDEEDRGHRHGPTGRRRGCRATPRRRRHRARQDQHARFRGRRYPHKKLRRRRDAQPLRHGQGAPGGSSGGTATAVNANFAVLGLGTETGGSIQNPAAAQALVGIKPTFGLVPLDGVVPIDATYVDVVGPLAKTVYDAASTLDVIAGPTVEDLATYAAVGHIPEEGYASLLNDSALEDKRFGLVGVGWRDDWLPLAPETKALYQRAIRTLTDQGAVAVNDPFLNSEFVELYEGRPGVPSVAAYNMLI